VADQWLVLSSSSCLPRGPYSTEGLWSALRSGQVSPGVFASPVHEEDWRPLAEIPELWSSPFSRTVPPPASGAPGGSAQAPGEPSRRRSLRPQVEQWRRVVGGMASQLRACAPARAARSEGAAQALVPALTFVLSLLLLAARPGG
jgi:hypothetical protein